jgi:hypothetical protein
MPFKANKTRRHRIPRQRHKVTNWPAYDAALRRRGSLTGLFRRKRGSGGEKHAAPEKVEAAATV